MRVFNVVARGWLRCSRWLRIGDPLWVLAATLVLTGVPGLWLLRYGTPGEPREPSTYEIQVVGPDFGPFAPPGVLVTFVEITDTQLVVTPPGGANVTAVALLRNQEVIEVVQRPQAAFQVVFGLAPVPPFFPHAVLDQADWMTHRGEKMLIRMPQVRYVKAPQRGGFAGANGGDSITRVRPPASWSYQSANREPSSWLLWTDPESTQVGRAGATSFTPDLNDVILWNKGRAARARTATLVGGICVGLAGNAAVSVLHEWASRRGGDSEAVSDDDQPDWRDGRSYV